MRGFDVLDPNLSLFENHFVEASAGTGKTFAIENLVVRLLNEGISLDEILVVTFTRAATVELKARIRSHLNSEQLMQFDEAKIWTIHSFCFHCLQEHAFQTGFSFAQVEESTQLDVLKQIIKDYLRTSRDLTPKQLGKILKNNPDSLVNRLATLVGHRLPIEAPNWDYQIEIERLNPIDPEELLQDLLALAPQYGKLCDRQRKVKPDVEQGLKRFTRLFTGEDIDPVDLPILHFVESNKLQKSLSPVLQYPGFLEQLQDSLIPKLEEFSNTEAIFAALAERTRIHVERVIEEEDLVFFEDLLRQMAKNVENPKFVEMVRAQFRAVLIDEFQDTDPLQWAIFSTLFLTEQFKGPLYLVGDPKQSIYRFRHADLYTYLDAKKQMGEKTYASLHTNFRSTPSLVNELNALFSKDFMVLPKTGDILPSPSVLAASSLPALEDGKGALHLLYAENEEQLFSTITHEIERLNREQNISLRECAVLVSDRFQAERFTAACTLPVVTKKNRSLTASAAFEILLELLQAAYNPRDRSSLIRVLAGPLFHYSLLDAHTLELPYEEYARFYRYHTVLTQEGILPFFQIVIEESQLSDAALYQDLLQLVEMAVHIKEDYLLFYQGLLQLDPDAETVRARAISEEDAIQLMTIHVSKGLEFSVVFPIGITTPFIKRKGLVRCDNRFVRSDQLSEAEEQAEKMRLLYVACTRAKQRLYLPILDNCSPLSMFLADFDLTGKSYETCQLYPQPRWHTRSALPVPTVRVEKTFPAGALYSYSALAPKHVGMTVVPKDILPTGPHTGTLIHQLFESFPFETAFHRRSLLPFVSLGLKGTFLEPWAAEVAAMMYETLHLPLPAPDGAFPLSAVNPKKILKEMEFLFPSTLYPGFLKGFIDLFFEHEGGYYLIDWKTNYIESSIEEVVKHHDYEMQATIYQTAIENYLRLFHQHSRFKGTFYVFLRSQQVYFFSPKEEAALWN